MEEWLIILLVYMSVLIFVIVLFVALNWEESKNERAVLDQHAALRSHVRSELQRRRAQRDDGGGGDGDGGGGGGTPSEWEVSAVASEERFIVAPTPAKANVSTPVSLLDYPVPEYDVAKPSTTESESDYDSEFESDSDSEYKSSLRGAVMRNLFIRSSTANQQKKLIHQARPARTRRRQTRKMPP